MTLTTRSRRGRAPAGFTLIEMLVVIAIITILVSITGVALQKAVDGQKRKSTDAQLYRLQQALDAEYDRIIKKCAADGQTGQIPSSVVLYAENNPDRATAIWTALHLRRQFPDSFREAASTVIVNVLVNGVLVDQIKLEPLEVFKQFRGVDTSGNPALTIGPPSGYGTPAGDHEQRAALLYLILAKKSASGGSAMAAAADDLSQGMERKLTFPANPNVTGSVDRELMTFGDSWNGSVGFRRWYGVNRWDDPPVDTVDLPEVQGAPYADRTRSGTNIDPLDTRNLVFNWQTAGQPNTQKQKDMNTILGFRGLNRMATVYSLGKDKNDPSDDQWGFRLRQYK